MQKEVEASYMVCAVIFGADETLLNVQLVDGFSFERLSLVPPKDHLDDIFDTTDIGLRRDYERARIDENNLDVICAVKKQNVASCLEMQITFIMNILTRTLFLLITRSV